LLSSLTASATSAITGASPTSAIRPTPISNSHLASTLQSAIGRSMMSISGTVPAKE
jgi:hypothetical protein